MKKHYETPTAEKLAFRYREQVVAASGSNPSQVRPGQWTSEQGADGCSYYLAEALGLSLCDLL